MTEQDAAVGTKNDKPGENTAEPPAAAVGEGGKPGDAPGEEQDTFPRDYVEKLRKESADYRTRAQRAEEAEKRLHDLAVAQAVSGILVSADELHWREEFADPDGWPDHDKIRAAAEDLVQQRPYLGRPSGDVGQGRHDDEQEVSLLGLLRQGA
jgi:hypothetical protein